MPLLDHLHAPLYPLFHWESFHSHWASILTNQLNGEVLPPEFVAAPHVQMGTEVEIDIGTLELYGGGENRGNTATEVYAPPAPALCGMRRTRSAGAAPAKDPAPSPSPLPHAAARNE